MIRLISTWRRVYMLRKEKEKAREILLALLKLQAAAQIGSAGFGDAD